MGRARGLLVAVGVVSILVALVGLLYNAISLSAIFAHFTQEEDIPYFYPAYCIMSAICIVCYILLLVCGIQFLRLRTGIFGLFVGILIFEVAYFFGIGCMWLIPEIGMSVGAATGVATGGLMPQFIILFPLWAPLLVGWARWRIADSGRPSNQSTQPTALAGG